MLLFAAAVGIKRDIIEAAAGAEGHLLPAVEAVHRRSRGVCATHGCSRSPGVDAERPRREQPWGARQRLLGRLAACWLTAVCGPMCGRSVSL